MELNRKTIRKMIGDGERLDGRSTGEYRDIEIEPGYIHETAEGSAKVTIGDTQVLVGVKLAAEEPFPDRPEEGKIVTNAELAPMAAREYESGPPQEPGVELARVVDRGIRESGAIDLADLVIEPGETVLAVFVDIHVLNDDGSLIDASALGALTALKTGYIPEYDEEEGVLDRDTEGRDIPLNEEPVTVTGHKIGDTILWDTTKEEEEAQDARLTVSINEAGNIVAMQKGEIEPYSQEDIMTTVTEAEEKTRMLREKIEEAVN